MAGHQLAAEMLLLGRPLTAHEAATRFGLYVPVLYNAAVYELTMLCSVNKVVPKTEVLSTAIDWAKQLCENSPDSVQATKRAMVLANQLADVEDVVVAHTRSKEMYRMYAGQNIKVRRRSESVHVPN